MLNHHVLLALHLVTATVCLLPQALKNKKPERLLQFEKSYKPAGIITLVLLVLTGL